MKTFDDRVVCRNAEESRIETQSFYRTLYCTQERTKSHKTRSARQQYDTRLVFQLFPIRSKPNIEQSSTSSHFNYKTPVQQRIVYLLKTNKMPKK